MLDESRESRRVPWQEQPATHVQSNALSPGNLRRGATGEEIYHNYSRFRSSTTKLDQYVHTVVRTPERDWLRSVWLRWYDWISLVQYVINVAKCVEWSSGTERDGCFQVYELGIFLRHAETNSNSTNVRFIGFHWRYWRVHWHAPLDRESDHQSSQYLQPTDFSSQKLLSTSARQIQSQKKWGGINDKKANYG